ncbi:tetratricopeptide repeat protein [Acuticoccus sediminis]|nr:tetratricopeptide repeat protein [Acuticoccus sediminis]
MRLVLTVVLVALTTPVLALPRWTPSTDSAVTAVQNRFLPRIFGGGEGGEQSTGKSDAELRIQQLETQVRMLTGQVEELTFTVRRLQSMIESGTASAAGQRTDVRPAPGTTGPGAPPSTLGQLPAQSAPSSQSLGGNYSGPVDLSALNGDLSSTPSPSQTSPAARNAAPASNNALDQVRDLQRSGRYAMAADAARSVLTDNPTGPVAGEARFMLGEALLAQHDYRGAANQFLENYTTDPNGARAPESLLKLGTALNGLGEREAACSSLEELFGAYPNVSGSLRAQAEAERRTANCA